MNKILIVDASESDRRLMSSLLTRVGYEPIAVDTMEAAKEEVAKLPPGAVVVTAMKFAHGTAQELVNWQKREGYKFPVIAIVDNLNPLEIADVMKGWGAVDIIQRPAIDVTPSMRILMLKSPNFQFVLSMLSTSLSLTGSSENIIRAIRSRFNAY